MSFRLIFDQTGNINLSSDNIKTKAEITFILKS